jgi:LuxR family maltose regulon positive regulatory protein
MLAEEHLNLIRAGKVDVLSHFLGLLSDEEIGQHPVAAAAGVIAAGDSDRQIARRRQLAAIAEANLDKVPEAQQRYVEFVVALGRSSFVDDELDVITRHATRAVELAQEHVHGLVVIALAVLAYGQYLRGDSAAARAGVEEAMAVPDAPRQLHGFIYARALQALLASDEGRPKLAEASARETVSMTRDLGLAATWSAGLAHHALGQALLQLGRAQEAERELERAEILRRAPEPRLDHVHSLLVLSQARIARGRLMLAATELESARERLGVFVERGRLEPLLRDVERQLDEAHAGSPRQIEPPTPAELAVLRLLATDLSQREIGSELFLSMNTVKTHARNIYGKLGVSSRKDAVRSANALGLI